MGNPLVDSMTKERGGQCDKSLHNASPPFVDTSWSLDILVCQAGIVTFGSDYEDLCLKFLSFWPAGFRPEKPLLPFDRLLFLILAEWEVWLLGTHGCNPSSQLHCLRVEWSRAGLKQLQQDSLSSCKVRVWLRCSGSAGHHSVVVLELSLRLASTGLGAGLVLPKWKSTILLPEMALDLGLHVPSGEGAGWQLLDPWVLNCWQRGRKECFAAREGD